MKFTYHHATALCLGWVLTVWSTILSLRANPSFDFERSFEFNPADAPTVMGYGGFPAQVFAYPAPPLGPGPHQSLVPLVFNFLFWAAAAYLVLRWSGKREERGAPLFGFSLLLVVASTVVWIGYLLLKFD
jgi:hypothetical protein